MPQWHFIKFIISINSCLRLRTHSLHKLDSEVQNCLYWAACSSSLSGMLLPAPFCSAWEISLQLWNPVQISVNLSSCAKKAVLFSPSLILPLTTPSVIICSHVCFSYKAGICFEFSHAASAHRSYSVIAWEWRMNIPLQLFNGFRTWRIAMYLGDRHALITFQNSVLAYKEIQRQSWHWLFSVDVYSQQKKRKTHINKH